MCCACGGGEKVSCKQLFPMLAGSDNKISLDNFYENEKGYGVGWKRQ